MKLSLKPIDIPFSVGDTVWVNQPPNEAVKDFYFQARIIQIILDGSFASTTVIRSRQPNHELIVSSAIYDLKPIMNHEGVARLSVEIQFLGTQEKQKTLFETEQELLDYQNQFQ